MSWFNKLVGVPNAAGIVESTGKALDGLFTSKQERLTHEEIMEKLRLAPAEMQTKIALAHAAHRSVFVAGWRPFIGWVAGVSLASFFIPQYTMGSYLWVRLSLAAIEAGETALPAYPVSADGLLELVGGLLGLALLRTSEKNSGVAK